MTSSQKTALISITAIAVIVLTFFVVSICLASAHGVGLVAEWQSWFGIVEEVVEDPEQTEEVVETTAKAITSVLKSF